MGVPSAARLSRPVALMSALPGACALVELRSTQPPPLWEISKSSPPTGWPLIVIRSFPLSAENTDGASAGIAAAGEEGGPKTRRLKPAPLGGAARTAAARDNASTGPSMRFAKYLSRFMTMALLEDFRRREFGPNVRKFQGPESARRRAWVLRRSRPDNRPGGNAATVPRRVYENSLHRGRAAGRP